jgi:hypothetical protein
MMGRPRGFWSERPRHGQEDARLLAVARLHALRALPYAALRARAARPAEVELVRALSGVTYRRRTAVKRFRRRGDEELRITIQVTTGGLLGRLNPLAEEVVLALPDGQMVGEYTLAAEGSDPRRYQWPTRDR